MFCASVLCHLSRECSRHGILDKRLGFFRGVMDGHDAYFKPSSSERLLIAASPVGPVKIVKIHKSYGHTLRDTTEYQATRKSLHQHSSERIHLVAIA